MRSNRAGVPDERCPPPYLSQPAARAARQGGSSAYPLRASSATTSVRAPIISCRACLGNLHTYIRRCAHNAYKHMRMCLPMYVCKYVLRPPYLLPTHLDATYAHTHTHAQLVVHMYMPCTAQGALITSADHAGLRACSASAWGVLVFRPQARAGYEAAQASSCAAGSTRYLPSPSDGRSEALLLLFASRMGQCITPRFPPPSLSACLSLSATVTALSARDPSGHRLHVAAPRRHARFFLPRPPTHTHTRESAHTHTRTHTRSYMWSGPRLCFLGPLRGLACGAAAQPL